MLTGKAYDRLVAARILDFFDSAVPWHRALWTVSTTLSLREVCEAAGAIAEGVLRPAAGTHLRESVFNAAIKDPGVDLRHGHVLKTCLIKADVRYGDAHYHALTALEEMIAGEYLTRWAAAIVAMDPPAPETTARSVAAALLDHGFSGQYLHRWWSYRLNHEAGTRDMADLLEEAQEDLLGRKPQRFTVFIPFLTKPLGLSSGPEWLSGQAAAAWLSKQGARSPVRHNGALLHEVDALDPWMAVSYAGEHVDRLQARVVLGTDRRLVAAEECWLPGTAKPFLLRRHRRVRVGALQRKEEVLALGRDGRLDSALALLAPLQEQVPTSAVTGSWAAVEGLLIGPGEERRSQAADRLAALVACSWPRAELTSLSHRHQRERSDALDLALEAAATNRKRSRIVAEALTGGGRLRLSKPSDQAGQERMIKLLAAPGQTLERVLGYVTSALLRLYRQRNLVLHGGRTEADCVALRASLRTAAPLVGAGFDRIVHAWLEHGSDPRHLAARARGRILTLDSPGAPHVSELLE